MTIDASGSLEPQRVIRVLHEWFAGTGARSVHVREIFEPEVDASDGYAVAYEASFIPSDSSRARIDVWVTDDGHVAFGIDRRGRIERGASDGTDRDIFAAGIEPVTMSEQQLVSLLDLAAGGRVMLRVTRLPWLGVVSITPFVAPGSKARAGLVGGSFRWLHEGHPRSTTFTKLVRYERW